MSQNTIVSILQSEIISEDRQNRANGITGQLLTLSEFNSIDKPQFEGLVKINGCVVIPLNHSFIQQEHCSIPILKEDYISNVPPYILEILLSENLFGKLSLSGGGALWPLMHLYNYKCDPPSDWDLFHYGLSNTDDIIIVENIIYNILQKYYESFNIVKCKGITQITTNDCKIQIIFKDYVSISEILHSFDISASKIAFDGREVYMTKSFAWTFITKLIIVSPEYRSDTYEIRLKKYLKNKTFGLIFKNIQIITDDQKKIELPFCEIIIQYFISPNLVIGHIKLKDIEVIEYTNIQNRYSGMGALDKLSSSQIFDINAKLFCLGKYEYFIYKETYQKSCVLNTLIIKHILTQREFNEYWAHLKVSTMITLNCEFMYELDHNIFDMIFYQYSNKETLKQQIVDLIIEINNRISDEFFPKSNTFVFSKKFMNELKMIISDIYNKNSNITIDWCSYINRSNAGSITAKKTDEEWNGSQYHQNIDQISLVSIKHNIEQFIINYNMDICAICFEQISPFHPNVMILNCGHIFHKYKIVEFNSSIATNTATIICGGIINWILKTYKCAICRSNAYCQPCDYF